MKKQKAELHVLVDQNIKIDLSVKYEMQEEYKTFSTFVQSIITKGLQ